MTDTSDLLGRVVLSKAGRDKGKCFLVTQVIDSGYVYVADGELRRLDNPKRKKIKHLIPQPAVVENIRIKLTEGKKVFDAEIRKALESRGYKDKPIKEEG